MKNKEDKTVVISVRIPVDLKKALDGKSYINRSKICSDALMKALSVDEERKLIRKRMDDYYKLIDELSQREDDLNKLEHEETNRIVTDLEKVLTVFEAQYERHRTIFGDSVRYYAKELQMEDRELRNMIEKYLDIKLVHDPLEGL